MKRSELILHKVFEAERNLLRAAVSDETISPEKVTPIASPNCELRKMPLCTSDNITKTREMNANIINVMSMDNNIQLTTAEYCPKSRDYDSHLPILSSNNDSEVPVKTPATPLYSPITPINKETFLSGANKNITISESSENSSPLRPMSPETFRLFETLSQSVSLTINDYSDDDSVKDPNYIADADINISSSDESTSHATIMIAEVHTDKPKSSTFFSSDKTRHQQVLRDITTTTEVNKDDIQVYTDCLPGLQQVTTNLQPNFHLLACEPLKRRRSENDLQKLHETKLISKKLKRCSSISGPIIFSPENLKPKSPKKKYVSDPSKWKRRIERDKRLKGEAYKTVKGKLVTPTPLKQPKCLEKPKHKCIVNVPEEAREYIYKSYRALGSLETMRQFIIQHVSKEKKKRSTTDGPSRKEYTHHYFFTVGHEKVSVCRDFFLDTLNIKEGIVRGALKKVSSEGVLLPDKRGKKIPPNKLSTESLNFLKSHIFSFPVMESHYCRKNTEYKYLESNLNIKLMYLLYKEKCENENYKPAGIETYRKIFRSYKLKFHVPKKDLCKKCVAYQECKSSGTINIDDNIIHTRHLKRRDDAYLRRDADKAAANEEKTTLAFNFDLQAVLSTPKGASGPFFYVRKLAVYNLTFYRFGNQDVNCFTWDETEGKRGSIEIATCVYKYISNMQDIKNVRMMSDNCGGQQKNFNFCCMLLYLVTTSRIIDTIDHVFYESGHSHMECDSVHSKIERKCKNSAVYTPEGWTQVMRMARTNPRPFSVTVFSHEEFLDFNTNQCQFVDLNKRKIKKKKSTKTEEEDEAKGKGFQDAVWIQYRKASPTSIFIKSDYTDTDFKELILKPKRGKNTTLAPATVYKSRLPISCAKKRDLLKLCLENQIPKYYHSYYETLPDSQAVEDRLPEPDADDPEDN